jgi:16S rRNA (guanine527-N7)-methyltransferase
LSHVLDAALRAGLFGLKLDLSARQVEQLLSYQELIQKWTRVYNLTAVRDAEEMLTHHLLDSLATVLPLRAQLRALAASGFLPPPRLLDVGSGAGLPGVVLAICEPGLEVSCIDAVGKKAAFIQQVAGALQLPNLSGVHARIESLREPHAVVCSRAFASLRDFTKWSSNALSPGGVWMALKGKSPDAELSDLPEGVEVFHVERLQVPGLDAERCIVWLRRK